MSSDSDTPHREAWIVDARLAWIVIALIAATHVAYYFPRCVDDLFISLRYAENLAHGRGIVLNPGERVEGYSSPLWMLLQALGLALGFEGVTWTKVLGVAALGALLAGTERLASERAGASPALARLAPAFLALDSHVVSWSVLGLETPAFLALLVWYPIVLHRYWNDDGRRSAWIAGAVTVALACARPEAPLYIGAIGLAELLAREPKRLRARVVRGARLAVPVLAVLVVLLLARRAYFGLWLPHTYYVKGATTGFELAKLTPLTADGVSPVECIFYLGGILLAVALAVTRRAPVVLVGMCCSLYFTASVERDWMPNLRHLLPLPVLAAVAWAWAVDRFVRSNVFGTGIAKLATLVPAAFVLVCGCQLASVDVRLSPTDKRDRGWVLPKTTVNMQDAWMSLRGLEPPHVAALDGNDMGMIEQNYRVLEAAAAPVDESWFIGRDIGQVAFYTGVRVFDTPGLFTPDVVQSATWRREHRVDGALIRKAFARRPVAAEILDDWTRALAAEQDLLAPYDIAVGSPSAPIDLMQNDRPLPGGEEILRRYEHSLAKFPRWFCLATLYGESSGGAMRRRVRRVREIVAAAAEPLPTTSLGRERGGGAVLEGAIESLGCEVAPGAVRAGEVVTVRCAWRTVAPPTQAYATFFHFDDDHGTVAFQDDHPSGAFRPSSRWRPGDVVRDGARVTVPRRVRPGTYRLYFGMWKGDLRPTVTPAEMTDGQNRIKGPTVEITP
jgi:hypothetical protein